MKKLISLCLSLVLALALAVPAAAAEAGETVAVQVNGETVTFPDAAPELKDGRTIWRDFMPGQPAWGTTAPWSFIFFCFAAWTAASSYAGASLSSK